MYESCPGPDHEAGGALCLPPPKVWRRCNRWPVRVATERVTHVTRGDLLRLAAAPRIERLLGCAGLDPELDRQRPIIEESDELAAVDVFQVLAASHDDDVGVPERQRSGHTANAIRRAHRQGERRSVPVDDVAVLAFADGLRDTIAWYQANGDWVTRIRSGDYLHYYERQYGVSS